MKFFQIFVLLFLFCFFGLVWAEDYTGQNFILRDPVITIEGGISTSTSFQYISSSGQTITGESTSSSFIYRAGFLYFPSIEVTPTPTPICGNNIREGNEQCDAGGSNGVCPATCSTSCTTNSCGGGGGGGGGGGETIITLPQILFKGLAYPASKITILKDGQVVAVTLTGLDAKFEVGLSGLSSGDYNFGVWAADSAGQRSTTRTFYLTIISGVNLVVSGIFLPPTISLDKAEVKRGDLLNIFGQTVPSVEVSVTISSNESLLKKVSADENGAWFYKLDTSETEYGEHTAKARSTAKEDISDFSQLARFIVSASNRENPILKSWILKGDFNNDNRVSLVDFSIAAYWYKRLSPPPIIDLNNNGIVDLADFSIMAYYWTG